MILKLLILPLGPKSLPLAAYMVSPVFKTTGPPQAGIKSVPFLTSLTVGQPSSGFPSGPVILGDF